MKPLLIILISLIVIVGSALWYFPDTVTASIAKIRTSLTKTTIKSANNTGLVGYWNFDDCDTCSTATDLSGNRNTGTFQADAAHTANGKINRGATFDGTGDYVLVNDSATLDLTSALTVSAWFNLNSLTSCGPQDAGAIVTKHDNVTTKDGYSLFYLCTDDKVYWQGGDGTTWASLSIASSKTFTETGRWYHVVGTFDGTTGYLYADGELTGSDTSAALSDNNQNLWIGGAVNVSGAFINGKLDEIRIYNRALSAAEVKTLYNQGSAKFTIKAANNTGLVGYWNFDDCDTCSTATDLSGNGNLGTMYNATGPTVGDLHLTNGKINRGTTFDGTNDYIDINDKNYFSPSVNDMTISFWARVSTSAPASGVGTCGGAGAYFITKGATNNWEWAVENDANNRVCWTVWVADGSDVSFQFSNDMTVNDNVWHQYTFVIDTGTIAYGYVDGVTVTTDNTPGPSSTNGTASINIGRRSDGYYFTGDIDEARIYNRALSAAEVKTLYQSGR